MSPRAALPSSRGPLGARKARRGPTLQPNAVVGGQVCNALRRDGQNDGGVSQPLRRSVEGPSHCRVMAQEAAY
eukprot:12241389-Alexandrium_andersonii.AAC.1